MKVIVIGAGVIGITTAYYLRRQGVEVILIEKNPGPGLETSYANAGSMTATRAGPWASRRTLVKTMKGYFSRDSALRLKLTADPRLYEWLIGFVVAAFSSARPERRRAMIELGMVSLSERRALDSELSLDYGGINTGLLTIHENAEDFRLAVADIPYLRSLGAEVQELSPAECGATEPAVDWPRQRIVGGIYAPTDESGDCYRFTKAIASELVRMGVEVRYGEQVRSLDARAFGACRVRTDRGDIDGDAVVVAAGIQSAALARMIGVKLPLCPVQGHSISVPLPEGERPNVTIAHESRKVFVSPCGNGVRAAGVADIVGYGRKLKPERVELLKETVSALYPSARLDQDLDPWTGLRDMTHDGPPIICGVPGSGLWFNAGHGTLGWTFACGAAKLVTTLVRSRTAEPDNPFLGLTRRWTT